MGSSSLPVWVQVLQALAVPVIAVVGAWIALQQMYLARVKLQHDLYDRRFAVYEAARKLLVEIITQGYPSRDQVRLYVIGTADAVFLLNEEVSKYLEEIRARASRLRAIHATLPHEQIAMQQQDDALFSWMTEQLPIGLVEKFKPFLTLERTRMLVKVRAAVRAKVLSTCSRCAAFAHRLVSRIK
jgi:hypothetical protein